MLHVFSNKGVKFFCRIPQYFLIEFRHVKYDLLFNQGLLNMLMKKRGAVAFAE